MKTTSTTLLTIFLLLSMSLSSATDDVPAPLELHVLRAITKTDSAQYLLEFDNERKETIRCLVNRDNALFAPLFQKNKKYSAKELFLLSYTKGKTPQEKKYGCFHLLKYFAAQAVNTHCPRSNRPVTENSLTEYRGVIVGFCNPHCRDDFAKNRKDRPSDTRYFDAIIAKLPKKS